MGRCHSRKSKVQIKRTEAGRRGVGRKIWRGGWSQEERSKIRDTDKGKKEVKKGCWDDIRTILSMIKVETYYIEIHCTTEDMRLSVE
jgi:hypothetical protein